MYFRLPHNQKIEDMKRLTILTVILFVAITSLQAQLNTGSKFVASNTTLKFHASNYKQKDATQDPNKYFDANLAAKGGYFLKNGIAIGGMIEYNLSKQNQVVSEAKTSSSGLLVGPVARYYTEYGSIIPFAEVSVGFGVNKTKFEFPGTPATTEKGPVLNVKPGLGADYFVNDNFAIEGMIYYLFNREKYNPGDTNEIIYIENGFGVAFGVVFYFGTI